MGGGLVASPDRGHVRRLEARTDLIERLALYRIRSPCHPSADYAKSIDSMTYARVGQSVFPHDHYAFWRDCHTAKRCRLPQRVVAFGPAALKKKDCGIFTTNCASERDGI